MRICEAIIQYAPLLLIILLIVLAAGFFLWAVNAEQVGVDKNKPFCMALRDKLNASSFSMSTSTQCRLVFCEHYEINGTSIDYGCSDKTYFIGRNKGALW